MNLPDWRAIAGWFDDFQFSRRVAREMPSGGVYLEVGVWQGRSVCALATALAELGKPARFIAVDTFTGTQSEPCRSIHAPIVAVNGGTIRHLFERNAAAFGIAPQILERDSLAAAAIIPRASLDCCFIDGDHTEDAVRADIAAWRWAVKPGGIIAGHDAHYPEVRNAVESHFAGFERIDDCWLVTL